MRKQVQIDRMADAALSYRKADREPQTPNRRTFAAGSDRSRSQERDATVTPRRHIPLCGWPAGSQWNLKAAAAPSIRPVDRSIMTFNSGRTVDGDGLM
jgi:hypothetical protein